MKVYDKKYVSYFSYIQHIHCYILKHTLENMILFYRVENLNDNGADFVMGSGIYQMWAEYLIARPTTDMIYIRPRIIRFIVKCGMYLCRYPVLRC